MMVGFVVKRPRESLLRGWSPGIPLGNLMAHAKSTLVVQLTEFTPLSVPEEY